MEQRLEDALAECWETATLKEPVAVLGFAEVHLQLSCDRPCAQIVARLCDIFPNGESSLITRGKFTPRGRQIPLWVNSQNIQLPNHERLRYHEECHLIGLWFVSGILEGPEN